MTVESEGNVTALTVISGLVLLVISIILIVQLIKRAKIKKNAEIITGTVEDIEITVNKVGEEYQEIRKAVILYSYDSKDYRMKVISDRMHKGDKVELYVSIDDPSKAVEKNISITPAIVLLAVLLNLFIGSLISVQAAVFCTGITFIVSSIVLLIRHGRNQGKLIIGPIIFFIFGIMMMIFSMR